MSMKRSYAQIVEQTWLTKKEEKQNMRTNTFLGFRNGKLVSIVTTTMDNYNDAVDCDRYVKNPENVEKQIKEWKRVEVAV